ncbi:MAG: glycerophosphoryl diester phosphodiesterase [Bacilli bacterium]|nr:glycerophosphoryl diester phosphodiesterase [Bacilli bacterium]
MSNHKTMVIGHRGAAGEAPENTMVSFQLALKQGAEGIELDVHLSKEGEIVVCHDATLDRTTNGQGYIFEKEVVEIKRYDAGSWFSEQYLGETVPLLAEVFDQVPDGILINVEIKYAYHGRMETQLIDFLRKRKRMENVVISSFDHKCLQRIKKMEPKVKIGLLYAANLVDHAGYANQLGVDVFSIHPHYQLIEKEDVQKAKALGIRTFPYTVNSLEEFRKMVEYGVSGIITDYPARLVEQPRKN